MTLGEEAAREVVDESEDLVRSAVSGGFIGGLPPFSAPCVSEGSPLRKGCLVTEKDVCVFLLSQSQNLRPGVPDPFFPGPGILTVGYELRLLPGETHVSEEPADVVDGVEDPEFFVNEGLNHRAPPACGGEARGLRPRGDDPVRFPLLGLRQLRLPSRGLPGHEPVGAFQQKVSEPPADSPQMDIQNRCDILK